ncbi:hypothetical protein ACFU44_33365 [Nocardia rhizosphaerihabitans]|uniref:hypothetical protein n=1 Tax=Nocardia rhizosphaerihabitans TaxID=1691570 RepID=UPI00366EEBF5
MKSLTWTPTHLVFEDWNHNSKWKAAQSPVRVSFDDIERVELTPYGRSRSLRWCRIIIRGRQTPADPMDDLCSFTYDAKRDAKKIDDMQARIARGVIHVETGFPGSAPMTAEQALRASAELGRRPGWISSLLFPRE